jgi:hypothetical protein
MFHSEPPENLPPTWTQTLPILDVPAAEFPFLLAGILLRNLSKPLRQAALHGQQGEVQKYEK